ncbi:constitutive coactivator of peroxisome proliferator-activated receptor gamma [Chanos chanos]|uniref:Constitutive coactivator of peroxisome proliferator-activated receptor gamma n=1 Tax=Chanos chanos TaxID=29144 RepID=A0A6J2V632_CHACN|nr:constitutive coactivator of peroxisome proliferator-activated receptor gamma [Chanos chanos]
MCRNMGVRGLQHFMESCYPETCIRVNLREMARNHVKVHNCNTATVVVDGMACLRYWYSCQAWVHGGQWQEYMHFLREFVDAFSAVAIRLVFFFDGTVEEDKRAEWVKRRLRVNQDIVRVFNFIKSYGKQPERDMFLIPSGLATFSRFALKSLGQETWCSVREGDYEIADYARRHSCMGILGQDSDFVIYDTVPYLSINKLRLDNMTTVLFSREKLCHILQLYKGDLPLLACLLGNDVVSEQRMQRLRNTMLTSYRRKCQQSQGDKVLAVADFVSSNRPPGEGLQGISSLPLSIADREVLEGGIRSYLLPGQSSSWVNGIASSFNSVRAVEKCTDVDILQAAREKHIRAECFMTYNILHDGVVECSNTLEDIHEDEVPPQAVLFQPVREHVYSLLLQARPGCSLPFPSVKEWFVTPGDPLKEPKIVTPNPISHPDGAPDLRTLWFGKGTEVLRMRVSTFMAVFDLQDHAEKLEHLDGPMVAVFCLVAYIATHTKHLSLEDLDAYLSQAVCIRFKPYPELLHTSVPVVDPRAVQLGSLFVRGLTYLIAANSACGLPFNMDDLMPWKTFDGLLFHSKYLQAHSACTTEELLEGNPSCSQLFLSLREQVLGVCRRCGVTIQSLPRRAHIERPSNFGESCRERGPQTYQARGSRTSPHSNRQQQRGPDHRPKSRHPNRRRYHQTPH